MKNDVPTVEVERLVQELARTRFECAKVFSFGSTEIDHKYFAVWITVDTDAQRDELANDPVFHDELVEILHQAHYPEAAIPQVGFAFESQETVDRNLHGNWWYAIK